MPNITGTLIGVYNSGNSIFKSGAGAFGVNTSVVDGVGVSGHLPGPAYTTATFDASDSNNIYGASQTVQPPAIQLIPQIRF